jgi:hypothetical protein
VLLARGWPGNAALADRASCQFADARRQSPEAFHLSGGR